MRPAHVFLAVLVAAVWGFNFVVIRIGITNFPPLLFSAFRFTLAALPLVFFIRKPDVPWRIIIGIGVVLGVVKFSLLFIGMDLGLSAGLASLVLQSQAFFTAILVALIYKELPRAMQVLGITVAFAGIGLIATTVDNSVTPLGLGLVVAAGFMWAVSNLLMKQAGQVDMLALIVWVSLVPPIPLFIMSLLFEGADAGLAAIGNLNFQGVGAILYIAFISTIFGFAVWGKLIREYGALKVAPFSLLVPIFGMGSSALVLGEAFGTARLVAAVMVIAGLVLTVAVKPQGLRGLKRRDASGGDI
ncbi:EamA family transporter [Profundibacter sp.]